LTLYNFTWEHIKAVLDILLAKPGILESLHAPAGLGSEAVIVLLIGAPSWLSHLP
jgi:hypothetical protein